MRSVKTSLLGVAILLFLLPTVSNRVVRSRSAGTQLSTVSDTLTDKPPTGQANVATNDDEVQRRCPIETEVPPCDPICIAPEVEEAPTGFDNMTNELIKQGDPIEPCATPTPGTFEADKFIFSAVDEIEDGLGPVYNAQSCRECHQNPVTGAITQFNELRAGHLERAGGIHPCLACPPIFVDAPGGSLINDRATDPKVQERVPPLFSAGIDMEEEVRTFRTALNTVGDGFVEAIPNQTLLDIAASQPNDETSGHLVHGQTINVPIEEQDPDARRICRIGRFGHKDQHASLLSFSGDAYLNEMGITNRLFLMENTSLGRPVEDIVPGIDPIPNDAEIPCDPPPFPVPGQQKRCGEDPEFDIDAFAQFMRATKAPPRDKEIADSEKGQLGAKLFHKAGCAVCHVDTIITAQEGTVINAGTFTVPKALASKMIHPFGDFLLHDIGTGDGIVQNGGQATRLKVRTAALWGVRTRTRLLHNGEVLTFMEAIMRHAGEAEIVRQNFEHFTPEEQTLLIIFLESL